MAHVELAKIQLQKGDLAATETECQKARSLLPQFHIGQAWAYRVMGQVALKGGQQEGAIRRFQQAAELFKMLGEEGEWEGVTYEIALLYADEEDLGTAFTVMQGLRHHTQIVLEERGIVL